MTHRPDPKPEGSERSGGRPSRLAAWRLRRWLPGCIAAMLWLLLVYGLPLQNLREARRRTRDELTQLLQHDKPDAAAILETFDRTHEDILFAASGPYLMLGLATLFLGARLAWVMRRLAAAEREIRALRD